jgi:transposase-like protein
MKENYQKKYLWCNGCRRKWRYSAARGTFLYGTKLCPKKLYQLVWCYLNRTSVETMRVLTGLSYTTIERWFEVLRRNLPYDAESEPKLSGTVKIDESYVGKQKSVQPQVIIVGAIESNPNPQTGICRIRVKLTNSRSKECLEDFCERYIENRSTVISDKWMGYVDLDLMGYDHYPFNHSTGEFTHTNQIEGLWSEIKRHARRTHGKILTDNIELILNEWEARHNHPELFKSVEKFLQRALQG